MTQTLIGKFLYLFLDELVKHGKNKPTDASLHIYIYYMFIYNLSNLMTIKTKPYTEELNIQLPLWYAFLRRKFRNLQNKDNLLDNLVFYGTKAMLDQMFKDENVLKNKNIKLDYGIENNKNVENIYIYINEFAYLHYESRIAMFNEPPFENKTVSFNDGFKADLNVWDNNTSDPTKWVELITPSGTITHPIVHNGVTFNMPYIDENKSDSYKTQRYLGNVWGTHNGFSVKSSNDRLNIIDITQLVPQKWEEPEKYTDLKREMEYLLDIYSKLGDFEKNIADLFAGSGKTNVPPPGQMLIIGNMMSQKYNQSQLDEIAMYFSLACGLFDSSITAWWYKAKLRQARPVTLIRHYYKNQIVKSWTFNRGVQDIDGGSWLPYQIITFDTPPFPDMASGHTVFSTTGCKLLQWWFNTDTLYDGVTTVNIPNIGLWSNVLDQSQKEFLIGEFCIRKDKSEIEQCVVPNKDIKLTFNTLTDFYKACGKSRVYGGIHSESTNQLSQTIAGDVYEKTKSKLMTLNIKPTRPSSARATSPVGLRAFTPNGPNPETKTPPLMAGTGRCAGEHARSAAHPRTP